MQQEAAKKWLEEIENSWPPIAFDTDADVFVLIRAVEGFDFVSFLMMFRDDVCVLCGSDPQVVRYTHPPVSEVRARRRNPIEGYVLCTGCEDLLTKRDAAGIAAVVARGNVKVPLPPDLTATAYANAFISRASSWRSVPIAWTKNDARFSRTDGLQPGTLGVHGVNGAVLCDAHEWLMQTTPVPVVRHQEFRNSYRERYGCAIPTTAALDLIVENAPNGVIDFGCGHGYWSYLLQQRGVDAIAVDNAPVEEGSNRWFPVSPDHVPASWTDIVRGDTKFVRKSGRDRSLLLVWPPDLNSMALHALQQFAGDTLIFIGLRNPSFCATATFFEVLERDWTEVAQEALPSFFGMDDRLYVYKRR